MRPRRFYSDCPPGSEKIRLENDELYHFRNVLRGKTGDRVEVFNGRGSLFSGAVVSLKSTEAVIRVEDERSEERPPSKIIIAPSLLKRKPMNLMLEKLTEMGVDEIRPVIFERTEGGFSGSLMKKWERIAMESLKVNDHLWPARIFTPCRKEELPAAFNGAGIKILLDIEGERESIGNKGPFLCVIGPPGDFTPGERNFFTENEYLRININNSVMKVETAAFSAAAILKYLTGKA